MKPHAILAAAALFLPLAASAQTAPAPAPKIYADAAEIQALIAKAKADLKPGAPLVTEPILSLAPYRAQLEYRPALAPAAVHEKDVELMIALEGKGNIITGGTLKDAKRTNAANQSGSGIEGGTTRPFAKGDVIIVPENTPHQVAPDAGSTLILMTLHAPRPTVNWP